MDWITLTLKIIENVSEYIVLDEKDKYMSEIADLKQRLYDERSKKRYKNGDPLKGDYRNDGLISSIEHRLYQLGQVFSTSAKK